MELHLVHKDSEGKLLVIGVLAQEGEEHNEINLAGAWVEEQVGHRMLQSGEEVAGEYQFNPMKVLPKDRKHFYAYSGSLTTPPYTEGVQWIVFKEPIELSREQLDRFIDIIKCPHLDFAKQPTYRELPWDRRGRICNADGECYVPTMQPEAQADMQIDQVHDQHQQQNSDDDPGVEPVAVEKIT